MAPTADRSLRFTQDRAVRRISPRGAITPIIDSLTLPGCRADLKVTSDEKVSTIERVGENIE